MQANALSFRCCERLACERSIRLFGSIMREHLAAIAHIGPSVPDDAYERINHQASVALGRAGSDTGHVQRLIFMSSIRAQTGVSSDIPLHVGLPPQPTDAYGRSKLAAEQDLAALPNLAVTSLSQQGEELKDLTLAFGEKFPDGPLVECLVIHGRHLHYTQIDRPRGQLSLVNRRELVRSYCTTAHTYMGGAPGLQRYEELEVEPKDPVEACFKRMLPNLVRRSLVEDFVQDVGKFRLPEDRIRLLVYAPMSENQYLSVDADIRRTGRILYVRDLLLNPGDQGVDVKKAESLNNIEQD